MGTFILILIAIILGVNIVVDLRKLKKKANEEPKYKGGDFSWLVKKK